MAAKRRRWDWWVCAALFTAESIYLWSISFTAARHLEGPPMTTFAIPIAPPMLDHIYYLVYAGSVDTDRVPGKGTFRSVLRDETA